MRRLRRSGCRSIGSIGKHLAILLGVLAWACSGGVEDGGEKASQLEGPASAAEPAAPTVSFFEEVGSELGIDFVQDPGFEGDYRMPEILGSGGALFDADGDGRLDLYLVNGGSLSDSALSPPNRLFLQSPDGKFRDATEESGTGDRGYGMGTAVGDVDNDGDLDLYVTNVGRDVFYRNQGGGRFVAEAVSSGLESEGWSTSAAFFDADGDGWLDLYVVRYVAYDDSQGCANMAGQREYCGPISFRGMTDLFFQNHGGVFEERGAEVGVGFATGKGLGVLPADFDGDGWTDLYVANDGEANFLWTNRGDGTFEEQAVMMGAAVNSQGRTEASMGLALGDVEGDGDLDLFVTHLMEETNTLYLDQGGAAFEDRVAAAGLGGVSLPSTGFGTSFLDAELDGDLDLVVANGKVRLSLDTPASAEVGPAQDSGPALSAYAEGDLFFLGDGQGRFEAAAEVGGELVQRQEISRGVLSGDLEGDGDLDLVVTVTGGPVRVYRNVAARAGRSLRLRTLLPELQRDAVGAMVTVEAGERRWIQSVSHTQSYLGSGSAELFFGLGEVVEVDRVLVRWPGGDEERFGPFEIDETGGRFELRRGEGES